MRSNKGITLVALIITIVVLLVIGGVAISSVSNLGIIEYANNASTAYKDEQQKESGTLDSYEDFLQVYNPSNTCIHQFVNGKCKLCGFECSHADIDYSYAGNLWGHLVFADCTICGTRTVDGASEECTDKDNDGECELCGECLHTNLEMAYIGNRDFTHNVFERCKDCTQYSEEIKSGEPCVDTDGDYSCDYCGDDC